ncbi:MAG TPA: VanZ family protein [Clostridia bacterium]|nr:VanZ family protein [Clostridia bacterium]
MTSVRSKRRLFLCFSAWLGVLIWMAVIFALSAQHSSESAALSGRFLAMLNTFFGGKLTGLLVRKAAHMTEYFLLAVLTFNAVLLTRQKPKPFLTFFIALLFAVSDEIHQHFVPGRACQIQDMLIDSVGVIGGILFCMAVVTVYRLLKKRKKT